LRAELKKVRQRGYAVDDREHQANMRCIAVPVRDRDGRVVAALSATDAAERMTASRQEEIRLLLAEAAHRLGAKLYPASFNPAVAAE
jgi:DNA-binding IclR family transcriptional regulator